MTFERVCFNFELEFSVYFFAYFLFYLVFFFLDVLLYSFGLDLFSA